jgi:putative ABC transport system permease protein
LIVLCCLLGAAAVVWACTHAILRRARVPGARANSALLLAFGALQRHAALNALQVLVFGLCIMLGLLMVLLRGALMDDWQRQLPARTPNHFLLNIAPYQVQPLQRFLGERKLQAAGLFPMVPGRVLEVNGSPARVQPGHELNLDRDWNLAWSDNLPEGNTLLEGQWWPADAAGEVSAEAGVARALGLKLGDRLALQIGADRIEARLTSIRDLDWDSMRPNFFLLFPRRSLEAQAAMWLTSFYLPPGSGPVVNELLREFPTVSVIEMDAILAQVRGVTRQLALAVELVLGLLLAAGALVMVASVQAGLELRFRESAILRTLGAGRGLVLGSLVMEFALLGGFAGVLATAGAESAAWLVQVRLMDLEPSFHPVVWVAGPLLGAVVCALLGMVTCRRVVDTPPAVVLRNGG